MKPIQEIDRRELECPYNGKACRKRWEKCAFKAVSDRTYDDGTRTMVYGCSQFMVVDEVICLTNRMAMVHKEMGETKNASLFQALAMLSDSPAVRAELEVVVRRCGGGIKNLLEGTAI